MAKINPDKKQVEYWQGRNERTFLDGEKDILDYAESLKTQYTNASKRIEDEIQKFYGKFAVDNNYTMADLKKLLNRDELKSFKAELNNMANYMKMNFDDKDYMKNIKLLRAKNRISRLEELQTKINFEVEKLYNDVNISLGEQLEQSFEDGYYKTIFNQQKFLGFSDSFAMLNTKAIKKAVSTPYMTENYSDVLWKQKSNLTNILNQQIPQGIILGYNPTKLAREVVSKRVDKQYYNNAVRLIRTEYNLILNDATAQGYKEAGIEKYQILATLDSRTSDICREMDGEIIPIKEKEVGVNYPPFHPNCRTTTIPYFEPDEFDTEIEQYIKDEDGIKHKITDDTQYEEWKNALKPKKDGAAIYENNMTKTEATQELSMPQKEAIEYYVSGNGMYINDMLRGRNGLTLNDLTSEDKIFMNNLDTALANSIGKDMKLFRSVDASAIFGNITDLQYENLQNILNGYFDNIKISPIIQKQKEQMESLMNKIKGIEIPDKGYVSTTKDYEIIRDWGDFTGSEKPIVLELNTPANIKGRDLKDFDIEEDPQKEVLLARNIKYKIKDILFKDNNIYVVADVLSK